MDERPPIGSVLVDEPGKWCGRVVGFNWAAYRAIPLGDPQEEAAEAFKVKERRRVERILSGQSRSRWEPSTIERRSER